MALFTDDEGPIASPAVDMASPGYLSTLFPDLEPEEAGGTGALVPSPSTTGSEDIMDLTPEGALDSLGNVRFLNVFGKRMEREELEQTDVGRKLIEHIGQERAGRAGFWEGVRRGGLMKLVPFLNDVAAVGMTIKDTVETKKTFEKLYNKENVTPEELLKARYFIAASKRESEQTKWGMLGGIISQAPAFAFEIFLSAGLGTAVKKIFTKPSTMAARAGIRGLVGDLVSKTVREGGEAVGIKLAREGAEELAGKTMRETVEKLGKNSVDDLALKILKASDIVEDTAEAQVLKRLRAEAGLYVTDEVTESAAAKMAAKALKYEAAMLNPRKLKSIGTYLGRRNSAMLLDYMDPENAVPLMARQRLGNALGLLYDAHIKGAGLLAADLAVESAVEALSGQEMVNTTELMLTASGALQGSEHLMKNAKMIALGMRWAEYMSEFTGPVFGEVLGAGAQVASRTGLGRAIGSARGMVSSKLDDIMRGAQLRKAVTQSVTGREIMGAVDDLRDVARRSVLAGDPKLAGDALEKAVDTLHKDLLRANHVTGFAAILGRVMARTGLGPKEVDKFLKDIAYDGMINEMLEERANGFIQGLYGLDDSPDRGKLLDIVKGWKNAGWGSSDQFMAEALGFALPGLARRGLQSVQVNLMAGERGKLTQLENRFDYLKSTARGGAGLVITRDKSGTIPLAETTLMQASEATAASKETQVKAQFGSTEEEMAAKAPVAAIMAEETSIIDGIAEWGSRVGQAASGSVSLIRKAGAHAAAFANALISGNPVAMLVDPSSALLMDTDRALRHQIHTAAIMHRQYYEHQKEQIRKTDEGKRMTAEQIEAKAQEAVMAPGSAYRRAVANFFHTDMVHHGVVSVTESDMENRVRSRLVRDNNGREPSAEEVKQGMADYEAALKTEVADFTRYTRQGEAYAVVSTRQGAAKDKWSEEALEFLTSQRKMSVSIKLDRQTIEQMQKGGFSLASSRMDSVTLDQIERVARLTDTDTVTPDVLELASAMGLDDTLNAVGNFSRVREAARVISANLSAMGRTLTAPGVGTATIQEDKDTGRFKIHYDSAASSSGKIRPSSSTDFSTAEAAEEALRKSSGEDVQWTARPLRIFSTPATELYSEDAVPVIMYDPDYFSLDHDSNAFTSTFAGELWGEDNPAEAVLNKHAAFQFLAEWDESKPPNEEFYRNLEAVGGSREEYDENPSALQDIKKEYSDYMAAAGSILQKANISRRPVAATGRVAWTLAPGAHWTTSRDGGYNLYLTRPSFYVPAAIAEDFAELMLETHPATLMSITKDGEPVYSPSVQAMVNKVRELLEGVKLSDHPPGMEGHLNLMRGIFAGDRYNREAVSKLVTAIVLGYDTSDIGGNPLGYAALRAIQDEIRASDEYKYFLAAVNDSFGGHAPLQQNGTFDALQRHIEARGAANMEDRKRDLAANANLFAEKYLEYQQRITSGQPPYNLQRYRDVFNAAPWNFIAAKESYCKHVGGDTRKKDTAEEAAAEVRDNVDPPEPAEPASSIVDNRDEIEKYKKEIQDIEKELERLKSAEPFSADDVRRLQLLNQLDQAKAALATFSQEAGTGSNPSGPSSGNSLLTSITTNPVLSASLFAGLMEIALRGDVATNAMTRQFRLAVGLRGNSEYGRQLVALMDKEHLHLVVPDEDFLRMFAQDLLSMLTVVDGVASRNDLTKHGDTLRQRLLAGLKLANSDEHGLPGLMDFTLSQGEDKMQQLMDSPAYKSFQMFAGILSAHDAQPNAYFGITQRMRDEARRAGAGKDAPTRVEVSLLPELDLPAENFMNSELEYTMLVSNLIAADQKESPRLYALGLALRIAGMDNGRKLVSQLRSQIPLEAVVATEGSPDLVQEDEVGEASWAPFEEITISTRNPQAGGGLRADRERALANGLAAENETARKTRVEQIRQATEQVIADLKEWDKSSLVDFPDIVARAERLAQAADALYNSRHNPVSTHLRDRDGLARLWHGGAHDVPIRGRRGDILPSRTQTWLRNWFSGKERTDLARALLRGLEVARDAVKVGDMNADAVMASAIEIDRRMDVGVGTEPAPDNYAVLQMFGVNMRRTQPISRVVTGDSSVAALAGGQSRIYYDMADSTSAAFRVSDADRKSIRERGTYADGTPLFAAIAGYRDSRGVITTKLTEGMLRSIADASWERVKKGARYGLVPVYTGSHNPVMMNVPQYLAMQTVKGTEIIAPLKMIFKRMYHALPSLRQSVKRQNISVNGFTHTHKYSVPSATFVTSVRLDRAGRGDKEIERLDSTLGGAYFLAGPAFQREMIKSHIDGPGMQVKGNGTYLAGDETFDDPAMDAIARAVSRLGEAEGAAVVYTDREGAKVDPFYDTEVVQGNTRKKLADYIADLVAGMNPAEGPVDLAGWIEGATVDGVPLPEAVPGLTVQVLRPDGVAPLALITRTQKDVVFHDAAHLAHGAAAQPLLFGSNLVQDMAAMSTSVDGTALAAMDRAAALDSMVLEEVRLLHDSMTPEELLASDVEILSKRHPERAHLLAEGKILRTDHNVSDILAKEYSAREERFRHAKVTGQHCQNVPSAGVARTDASGRLVMDRDGRRVQLDHTHGAPDVFSESSYVFTEEEQERDFHGFSRRLSLQRTNMTQPWARPGLFVRADIPNAHETVADVIRELYTRRGDRKAYFSYLSDVVMPMFEDREGRPLVFDDPKVPGAKLYSEVSFDDLMVPDPRGGDGLVFDWPALYWGRDSKDTTGKNRVYLAGSLCYTSRTPSGSPNASDVYRMSSPVRLVKARKGAMRYVRTADGRRVELAYTGDEWIPEDINITQRTAVSTALAGLDKDGDTDTELMFKYDSDTGLVLSARGRTLEQDRADFRELVGKGMAPEQARDLLAVPYMNDVHMAAIADRRRASVERVQFPVDRTARYDYVYTIDTLPVNPKVLDPAAYKRRLVDNEAPYQAPADEVYEKLLAKFPQLLPEPLRAKLVPGQTVKVTYAEYKDAMAKVAGGVTLDEYLFSPAAELDMSDLDQVMHRTAQVQDADAQRGIAMAGVRTMHTIFARKLYGTVRGDNKPGPSAKSWRLATNWLFNVANATFDEEKEAALSRLGFTQATMPLYIGMLMQHDWESSEELHAFHDLWMAWSKGKEAGRAVLFSDAYKGDPVAEARRAGLLEQGFDYFTGFSKDALELWAPTRSVSKLAGAMDSLLSVVKTYVKSAGEAHRALMDLKDVVVPALNAAALAGVELDPRIKTAVAERDADLTRKVSAYHGHVEVSHLQKAYDTVSKSISDLEDKEHASGLRKLAFRPARSFAAAAGHVADVYSALRIMDPGLVDRMRDHGIDTAENIIVAVESVFRTIYAAPARCRDAEGKPRSVPDIFLRSININSTDGKTNNSFLKPATAGMDIMQYIDQVWTAAATLRETGVVKEGQKDDPNHIKVGTWSYDPGTKSYRQNQPMKVTRGEFMQMLFLYNALVSSNVDSVPSSGSGFGFMFPPEMMANHSRVRTEAFGGLPPAAVDAILFTSRKFDLADKNLPYVEDSLRDETLDLGAFGKVHARAVSWYTDDDMNRADVSINHKDGRGKSGRLRLVDVFRFEEGRRIPSAAALSNLGQPLEKPPTWVSREEELGVHNTLQSVASAIPGAEVLSTPELQDLPSLVQGVNRAETEAEAAERAGEQAAHAGAENLDGEGAPVDSPAAQATEEALNARMEKAKQMLREQRQRNIAAAPLAGRTQMGNSLLSLSPVAIDEERRKQSLQILSKLKKQPRNRDGFLSVTQALSLAGAYDGPSMPDRARQGDVNHLALENRIKAGDKAEDQGSWADAAYAELRKKFPADLYDFLTEVPLESGDMVGRADILAVKKDTGQVSVIDVKPWRDENSWNLRYDGHLSIKEKQVAQVLCYQGLLEGMGFDVDPTVHILFHGDTPVMNSIVDPSDLSRAVSVLVLNESGESSRISEETLLEAGHLVQESIQHVFKSREAYEDYVKSGIALAEPPGGVLQYLRSLRGSLEHVTGFNDFVDLHNNLPPGNTEQDELSLSSRDTMKYAIRAHLDGAAMLRGFTRTPDGRLHYARAFAEALLASRIVRVPGGIDQFWGPKLGIATRAIKSEYNRLFDKATDPVDIKALQQLHGIMTGMLKTRRLLDKLLIRTGNTEALEALNAEYLDGRPLSDEELLRNWTPPPMPQAYDYVDHSRLSLSAFKLVDGSVFFDSAIRPIFRGMDIRSIVSNRVLEGFAEKYNAYAQDLRMWLMLDDPFHARGVRSAPGRLVRDEATHRIRAVGREEADRMQRSYSRITGVDKVLDTYRKPEGVTDLMDWVAKTLAAMVGGGKSTDTNIQISTVDYKSPDRKRPGPTGAEIRALSSPTAASDARGTDRTSTLLTVLQRIHDVLPPQLVQIAVNTLADTADSVHQAIADLGQTADKGTFEQMFLERLANDGWALVRRSRAAEGETGERRIVSAVLAVPAKTLQRVLDTDTELQQFLEKTGRTAAMAPRTGKTPANGRIIDIEALADLLRQLNQEMTQDVMNQIPLTMGGTDAHMLFGVYDTVPFIPGTGYYRRGNVAKNTENLLRPSEKLVQELDKSFEESMRAHSASDRLADLIRDDNLPWRQLKFFQDLVGESLGGKTAKQIAQGMVDGQFAHNYGIPADPTVADFAYAIHRLALRAVGENAIRSEDVVHTPGQTSVGVEYGSVIRSMERMAEKYNMRLDVRGMSNAEIYDTYGFLSSGVDALTALAARAENLANGLRFRSAINMALMAEDAAGHPVVYALPGDDNLIVPDEMWNVLARWWAQANNFTYNDNLSAKDNAREIFKQLRSKKAAEKTLGHGVVRFEPGDRHPYEAFHHIEKTGLNELPEMLTALSRPGDTESSIMGNIFCGGDTAGFMTQLFEAADTRDRHATHYAVDHVLQWSKAMSMSFSLFHIVATGWESLVGAMGSMHGLLSILDPATMRKLGGTKLGRALNMDPGSAGMNDFVRMIHSPTDPFMIELRTLMRMVNIPMSNSRGNPLDVSRTIMRQDFNKIVADLRKQGMEVPERFISLADKAMKVMTEDTMEYTFEYVANAVKMAVVANTITRLRAEAMRTGKWFDPIVEMRKWGPYIGAEVGGMDPVMYPWATPQARKWLNRLVFSWQWTAGAWEAGGMGVLTRRLSGFKLDKSVQKTMPLRWMRMYLGVMFGVPAVMQMVSTAVGKATGTGDEDDKWFIWHNEPGKTHSFNITPFLKLMARAPGIPWAKENIPLAGRLIPASLGLDPTQGDRKIYMHFGKQGWEIGRWFTDFIGSAFSKASLPVQKFFEAVNGSALNSDWNYEFKGKNLIDGFWGRLKHGATMFVPFSFSSMRTNADAGVFNLIGPIGKGVSRSKARDEMAKLLSAYARNDLYSKMMSSPNYWNNVDTMLVDWMQAAEYNGHDPETVAKEAYRMVLTDLYRDYYAALPSREGQKPDMKRIEKVARGLHRMDFVFGNLMKSVKTRDEARKGKLNISEKVKATREEVYSQSFWKPNG